MNIGLPGTGIGGIFYLLTIMMIFGYELLKKIRRKNRQEKWTRAVEQLLMAVVMILIAVLTNEVVSRLLGKRPIPPVNTETANLSTYTWHYLQVHPILVPFILLFLVMSTVHILYVALHLKDGMRTYKQP